jgi:hypothetical protein
MTLLGLQARVMVFVGQWSSRITRVFCVLKKAEHGPAMPCPVPLAIFAH